MDEPTQPSAGAEITELVKRTPEWAKASALVRDGLAAGRDLEALAEEVAAALDEFLDRDGLVESVRSFGTPLSDSAEEEVRRWVARMATESVAAELRGEKLPLIPGMTGGVSVMWQEDPKEGLRFPIVIAMAGPLTPPSVIDDFRRTYDSLYRPSASEYPNGLRDAGWAARNAAGESYRDIALADTRAGLAPEARVSPEEYADEVDRAADLVAKAVQRLKKRWTQIVDSMSTDSE